MTTRVVLDLWSLPRLRIGSSHSGAATPECSATCRNVGTTRPFLLRVRLVCQRVEWFGFGNLRAVQFLMGIECTATDTTLIIRCPYCVVGIEFRPMIAYKDGRFVCRDCAHTVRPGVSEYRCSCRPCLTLMREPCQSLDFLP